ncbi:MAG TPA: hypothetical protein VII63_08435 [Caulobacteraceae bacterium]
MAIRPRSTDRQRGLGLAAMAALFAGLAACGGHGTAATASGDASPAAPTAASPADPANPLIGAWRFIGFGKGPAEPSGCSTQMVFSPGQWTQTQGGATTNMAVTFIPGPKTVYVVDANGGHITYVLIDQNHIALNSFAPCTYERVG